MNEALRCIACGSSNWKPSETWKTYHLATCCACGVTFTVNPDYAEKRYVAAYDEWALEIPVPAEHRFVYTAPARRLMWEAMAFPMLVPTPRFTPAEKLALGWLRAHAPREGIVIDCGCGTGRFLRGLARAHVRAIGVELSEALVQLLTRGGFEAILGAAPEFPWSDFEPFAITFFEVLEHVPDPARVLGRLRERFPQSTILASVPSPLRAALLLKNQRSLSDYPPNHYVRWTPVGLRQFFESIGYSRVSVALPAPVGSEMVSGLGQLIVKERRLFARSARKWSQPTWTMGSNAVLAKRAEATIALWLLKAYQILADLMGFPLAVHARRRGATAGSMLVIASP